MKNLSKEEALHCAKIFNDYFGQFDRIDQYMRDQKMAQIDSLPASLPGMGFDSDMFDDFSISPEDMDLEIVELDNHTWDTCINMISSHSNMVSIPGKSLKLAVKDKKTGKWVGFMRFGSPVINCKPRNVMLGNVPDLKIFKRGLNLTLDEKKENWAKFLKSFVDNHTFDELKKWGYNRDIILEQLKSDNISQYFDTEGIK